jgi:hypothetical protein
MEKKSLGIPSSLKELVGSAMTTKSLQRAKPIDNADLQTLKLMLEHWPFDTGAIEIRHTKELLDFILLGNNDTDIVTRKMLQRFHEILLIAYPIEKNTILH